MGCHTKPNQNEGVSELLKIEYRLLWFLVVKPFSKTRRGLISGKNKHTHTHTHTHCNTSGAMKPHVAKLLWDNYCPSLLDVLIKTTCLNLKPT